MCIKRSMDRQSDRMEGGIFREEMPHQLLSVCRQQLLDSLTPVYKKCHEKADADDLFDRCMQAIRNQWTDTDFDTESADLCKRPRAEDAFRYSFISYVKLTHTDPTSQEDVQVRVTVPLVSVFTRHFLREASAHSFIRRGRFFSPDADVLQQEQAVKQAIRGALALCANEYVIIEQLPMEPVANNDAENTVEPDDSASNVSPSSHTGSRVSKSSKATKNSHARSASSHSEHKRARTAASAITSFDLRSEKHDGRGGESDAECGEEEEDVESKHGDEEVAYDGGSSTRSSHAPARVAGAA